MRVAFGTTQNLRAKTGRSLKSGWHAGIPFEKCGCRTGPHARAVHTPRVVGRGALVIGLGVHGLLLVLDVPEEVIGDCGLLLGSPPQLLDTALFNVDGSPMT